MDQIADLLTRIKNTSAVGKSVLTVSHSRVKETILAIFKKEGFVTEIEVKEEDNKKSLKITLATSKPTSHLRQISTPGRRIYVKSKAVPKPLRGLGTVIVSTSTGIVTGREAAKLGLGGELICEIW